MKNSVAAYLCLSKEEFNDEKKSNSITNQKQIIDDYLKKHKEYKIYDYYIDDGYSGTNFNRPEFQRMLEDILNKKINIIVIKDLSRLGRNYIEVGNYLENIFPVMGVFVIVINEDMKLDSSDYYSNEYVTLRNLFNDMYAVDISKKVKSALAVKNKNGEFVGKLAPYGYIKDPEDKHKLIIDKYAAGIVKKIFTMTLEFKSRNEIADILNKGQIYPPSKYKAEVTKVTSNKTKIASKWNPNMVRDILKNEVYIGNMVQGKLTKPQRELNLKIYVIWYLKLKM